MTSQRAGMILYAGVGIGILVLSLFGDASSEVGFRIEFALRMLVMTAGIVIGVRGVVKKDVAFLLIGAGFVVATYDLSNRWLMIARFNLVTTFWHPPHLPDFLVFL